MVGVIASRLTSLLSLSIPFLYPTQTGVSTAAVAAPVEVPAAPMPMEMMEDAAPALLPLPAGVEDIDEHDAYNTQMATEYVTEIYKYMRELEVSL